MLCLVLTGCGLLPGPKIRIPGVTVQSVKDAGKPAVVNTHEAKEGLTIPKGSKFSLKQKEAIPASSESPAQPAVTEVEIQPSEVMQWSRSVNSISADTGTVDTTVAKHRIDAEERRPLLYAGIAAAVVGLGFMYVRFQAIAVMCFVASGAFFLAWRMAEISPWVGGMFLVAAVAGFAFYKRAEWDANGDFVPDVLQRKTEPK